MRIHTLLNFAEKHKGFVYERVKLVRHPTQPEILVQIRPRKGSKGLCSNCGRPGRTHARTTVQRWRHVPLWGIAVFFLYALRRIACAHCNSIHVEKVPWASGRKQQMTTSFMWFLSRWANRMSWEDVRRTFKISWHTVYKAVQHAVDYGLAHRKLDDVKVLGVDEIMCMRKLRTYFTVVYALDQGKRRLLWIGKHRTEDTLNKFFDFFGDALKNIEFVASDMWQPFMNVIRKRVPRAHNVLDRFHLVANLNKAVDKVRAKEARELLRNGVEILKRKRWLLLKGPDKLSPEQSDNLDELVKVNLRTVKAYLLKEDFNRLWDHFWIHRAAAFLRRWCQKAKASELPDFARLAKTFQKKSEYILNWFVARGAISSGAVEGLNRKAKLILRRAYGRRNVDITKVALYHGLGKLPEPSGLFRYN